jgi:predicted Zn-dependent protease
VEYSTKIGYDARQMAGFFNTLKRKGDESGSGEIPNFLSTHPDPGERNTTVAKLAAEYQQQQNLTNPQVNRNEYLRRIEGLIYGEDPKGGYRENNVFYHPELRFQFNTPNGWAYQNTPQRVQLAPSDGRALFFMTLAQGNSLQAAASQTLQQYKLQAIQSRETTVNGLRAIEVVADQQQPQQQQQQQQQQQASVRTLSYFIQHGSNIYHLIGVSSVADFNAYTPAFTNIMQSFRELTDASKINKKPERVRLKNVTQATTLQQFFRNNNVPDKRMEEFAILNGMQLSTQVSAGTLIKIIQE